ncbi:Acg family FMN-binding oxidoreductase [Microbispora bryophytorum]|uniref:Nitroreductase family protein n=1 Tax=Microbispora bryophytorum subsp. camponoti TaxID=1677852 RepID=A0ABR8L4L2_9ACTN|nr:nitroreductase family protein [Microbispora camponoti]MBD3145896.1 nitroreductase family protein [Microbispora camponoti]
MHSPFATERAFHRLLTAAGQAPSVLNTQPWRLAAVRGEFAELLADPDRRLRVSDPRGRSLHVSCGAALFNLRLAVRTAGHRPLIWLLPNTAEEPQLLAAVRVSPSGPASGRTRELYDHIGLRRTNREPFGERPVPPHVLADLRHAAACEGARLVTLERHAAADLLEHIAVADDELGKDGDYQAELRAWTMSGNRRDGLPSYVRGPGCADDPAPVRDFGTRGERRAVRFESSPRLAVLTTSGDGPADWLRAGQALQRLLLTATVHGVSASFLNQPLDLRDMRRRSDPHHRRGHIQMIIRLGYGPAVPRAPRRPAAELRGTPPARPREGCAV